jgi:hypothetical protein
MLMTGGQLWDDAALAVTPSQDGYDGLYDRRKGKPSPKRAALETVEKCYGRTEKHGWPLALIGARAVSAFGHFTHDFTHEGLLTGTRSQATSEGCI